MKIILIAAAGQNNEIGQQGSLPWRVPEDLLLFKNKTFEKPVIMGRKTFESIGSKALKGRKNIVVSGSLDAEKENSFRQKDLFFARKPEDALEIAREEGRGKDIFVMGGAILYKTFLPSADEIYLSRIHADFPEADTFFPDIDLGVWDIKSEEKRLSQSGLSWSFCILGRR